MACVFPTKALLVFGNTWVSAAIATRGRRICKWEFLPQNSLMWYHLRLQIIGVDKVLTQKGIIYWFYVSVSNTEQ
ncbi:hypothetical protein RhiirA5_444402 [Rhizophagus irregularis]|uniref:Secreted protein n=1 Tax=Rhizophagus irregularis TaxID=588596 RepID=A0A2N0ND54_9GLOM|nr:hypothetical protein RhiirA5_444402 [Rhizophagus irregularis]